MDSNLKSYIIETIDNIFLFDKEKRDLYGPQVFDILKSSYAKIGGIKGSGFTSIEDMKLNIPFWKIYRKGSDVKVIMMYKDKGGRKRVAIGTDGTPEAKAVLANMLRDEFKTKRSFSEISGPSLKFIQKILSPEELEAIVIPFDRVKEILKSDYEKGKLRDIDGVKYEHYLNNVWVTKVMLGAVTPLKNYR